MGLFVWVSNGEYIESEYCHQLMNTYIYIFSTPHQSFVQLLHILLKIDLVKIEQC